MKGPVTAKLGVGVVAMVMLCGCLMMGRGPSDEDLIARTVEDYKAAMIANDLDKIMATFSENYQGSNAPDKESLRDSMEQIIGGGILDDLEVDLENLETTIEGDEATVYGIELSTAMGEITMDLTLKKEDGKWLIVQSEYSM